MRTENNSLRSLSRSPPLRPCCCHVAEIPINNRHHPHGASQRSRVGDMDSRTFLKHSKLPTLKRGAPRTAAVISHRGDKEAREKGGHWSQLILPIKFPRLPSCSQSPLGTHHSPAQPSTFLHLPHSTSHPQTSPYSRNSKYRFRGSCRKERSPRPQTVPGSLHFLRLPAPSFIASLGSIQGPYEETNSLNGGLPAGPAPSLGPARCVASTQQVW